MSRIIKTCFAGHPNGRLGILACISFTCLFTTNAAAQKKNWTHDRIEEDWELVLAVPDGETASPQIALQMKPEPTSPLTGMFLINYHDTPKYVAGGVQIQMWNHNTHVAKADHPASALTTRDEVIPFTVYMDRSTGNLRYGVCKGYCIAWGDLGADPDAIRVEVPDSTTSFPDYDSAFSVRNAEIVCGATRVKSLRLLEVRKYYSAKKLYEADSTIHQVYP